MRNAENKVIETLLKISKKFPSAKYLASAVEEYGLFDGLISFDEEGIHCYHWWEDGDRTPFDHYGKKSDDLSFGCANYCTIWKCILCSGSHYIKLSFNVKNGDLMFIIPDSSKSKGFWKTDTFEERSNEIEKILRSDYGSKRKGN